MSLDAFATDIKPRHIKQWGHELGFQQIAITDLDVTLYRERYERWLADGRHGEMKYLERRMELRFDPSQLVAGSCRAIVARMDYQPPDTQPLQILEQPDLGYISRYALGRDYHKVVRGRLRALARRINERSGPAQLRAFTDSAPILEKALAEKAGLGWIGKHTLLLNRSRRLVVFPGRSAHRSAAAGRLTCCRRSLRTLSRLHDRVSDCGDHRPATARRTPLHLLSDDRIQRRNSAGTARVDRQPDFRLRRLPAGVPVESFRAASAEADFLPRHALDRTPLLDLFGWSEAEFLARTEGSALRRINYEQWQRNVAVALGNAPYDPRIVASLRQRRSDASPLVAEHIDWALDRQLECETTYGSLNRCVR